MIYFPLGWHEFLPVRKNHSVSYEEENATLAPQSLISSVGTKKAVYTRQFTCHDFFDEEQEALPLR